MPRIAARTALGIGHGLLGACSRPPLGHRPVAVGALPDGEREPRTSGCVQRGGLQPRGVRRELEGRGHSSDRCDAEVVVHGYEDWVTGVYGGLREMLGRCDRRSARTGTLLLARDALGIKPLVRTTRGRFGFASDALTLIRTKGSRPATSIRTRLMHIWRSTMYRSPARDSAMSSTSRPVPTCAEPATARKPSVAGRRLRSRRHVPASASTWTRPMAFCATRSRASSRPTSMWGIPLGRDRLSADHELCG